MITRYRQRGKEAAIGVFKDYLYRLGFTDRFSCKNVPSARHVGKYVEGCPGCTPGALLNTLSLEDRQVLNTLTARDIFFEEDAKRSI